MGASQLGVDSNCEYLLIDVFPGLADSVSCPLGGGSFRRWILGADIEVDVGARALPRVRTAARQANYDRY